jgi:1-acyl-sn-glycerol-3-phosphate acyltransferase
VDSVSAERLIERMIPFRGQIKDAEMGRFPREGIDDLAAVKWGIPVLADFFATFRLGAPDGLLNLSKHLSPEAMRIRGALAVFGTNSNPTRASNIAEATAGVVSDQTHGDTMDYAAVFASRYLFWGGNRRRPSIIAESVFNYIPIMGSVLRTTTGGFLSRKDKEKRERFLQDVLSRRLREGRDVAQFGEGTRRLTNPFAARYSDLSHPGALHNPAEFLIPGSMRGLQFRLALENKTDVHVYAAKIQGAGSGEPSIPRSVKGFISANYTEFSYRPPLPENGFVALAGILPYGDLIKPEDFPGEPFHQILARNVAVNRRLLRRTGLNMDAGPNNKTTSRGYRQVLR